MSYLFVAGGFGLHLANASRDHMASCTAYKSYCWQRLSRVLLTTYLSQLAALVFDLAGIGTEVTYPLPSWSVGSVLWTLLQPGGLISNFFWFLPPGILPQEELILNAPAWFIGVIIPLWLLYPLLSRGVKKLEAAGGWIALLTACAVVLALRLLIPTIELVTGVRIGGNPNFRHDDRSLYEFALGVCAAALARRHNEHDAAAERATPERRAQAEANRSCRAILADVAAILFVLMFHLMFQEGSFLYGLSTEALTQGGIFFLPMFALFLYGSSAGLEQRSGVVASALSHRLLVVLGEYAFAIYLWANPLACLFDVFISGTIFTRAHEYRALQPIFDPTSPVNATLVESVLPPLTTPEIDTLVRTSVPGARR